MNKQTTFFEQCQQYQIGLFVGRLNWDNWDSYENGTDPNCIETRLLKLTNKYFAKNLSLAEMCEQEGLDVNEFLTQGFSIRARVVE